MKKKFMILNHRILKKISNQPALTIAQDKLNQHISSYVEAAENIIRDKEVQERFKLRDEYDKIYAKCRSFLDEIRTSTEYAENCLSHPSSILINSAITYNSK